MLPSKVAGLAIEFGLRTLGILPPYTIVVSILFSITPTLPKYYPIYPSLGLGIWCKKLDLRGGASSIPISLSLLKAFNDFDSTCTRP